MSAGFQNALSVKEEITPLAVDVGHQVPRIAQVALTRAQTGFQPKTPQPPSCCDATLNMTFAYIDESTSFFCATGQQEDAQDAGGGAAGEEGAGAGDQEGPEEHERPHLGRDQPLRSASVRVHVHDLLD